MDSEGVIGSIHGIYERFRIPGNLQMHMFRVAGVGELISNNWKGLDISKEDIVAALLIHDIGNIVKFNMTPADPMMRTRAASITGAG